MNENGNADEPTTHAGQSPDVFTRAAHDSKSAVLAVLVDRLGGRCVITDDEFAEAVGRGVRIVRDGGEMVIKSN